MVEAPPVIPSKAPPRRPLRYQQEKFCHLVASGERSSRAYRIAYKRPKATLRQAKDRVAELMSITAVRDRIRELQLKSEGRTLLTINDRLKLLADNAKLPSKTAAARNAQARAIEVYNKTAGDQAPERVELLGDAEKPLHVVGRSATKQEKIAALLARRQAAAAIVSSPSALLSS